MSPLLLSALVKITLTPVGSEGDLMLKRMATGLPEHLVGLEEERWGDRQAQGLGGLEIED
jgi:hypothetical protein